MKNNITRKILLLLLISILILNVVGCSNTNGTKEFNMKDIDQNTTEKNSEFAFEIFKELNKEDIKDNIFISPLSISTALTMTYNGAVGKTKEDMEKALQYTGLDIDEINNTYKNLLPYLSQVDKSVELDISNSIWYREGEQVKEGFINTNKDVFDAEVTEIDFSKENAADIINDWIKESTKGKIDKMLSSPISPDVIMYLINAVYFKGDWANEFDKKNTFTSQFNNIDGKDKEIQMMNKKSKVDYGSGDDYKVVRLPYGQKKINMYCVLPGENEDINSFIGKLNNEKFGEIRNSISETEDVILQIPKFKLEYGIKNLNNTLSNMGMKTAFQEDADFSKIREGIFISRVLHKAVIEVNEEGSEAAGVTVVEMTESAVEMPITFIANRPFVFLLMDEETGTILFMGKYCR